MIRKYAVIATILWFATSSRAFALGLGEIEVQSALNDPFQAVIALTSATDNEIEELKVSIASPQSFQRAGIPRPLILSSFRFKAERTSAGKPVIRISTKDSIHEPFLEFLVEAVWAKGRMVRQYTVLIDPPYTMPATPSVPAAPVTRAPSAAAAAPEPAPAISTPAAAPVPVQAAPAARTPAADNYGPIRRNETLWTIAKRLRPDSGISMEQMMLALQRANPDAFIKNNINNLKAGAVLAVPDREEILAMSVSDATRETGRQNSEWKSARAAVRAETAAQESTAVSATDVTETRLQLVAPEADAVEAASAAGGTPGDDVQPAEAGSNELEQQLAMATEEAEASRAQSSELQARVTELEDQVTDMQRLLELKDAQLASMQNRQAGAADTLQPGEDTAAAQEPVDAMVPDAEPATADAETTAPESQDEAGAKPVTEPAVLEEPNGLVDRLLDNPVLTALGVIVAMVLGGFLWASTRQRKHSDLFSEEPTLASRLSESRPLSEPVFETKPGFDEEPANLAAGEIGPLATDLEGDPLTEADVFIAYGRVQQAEDVIQGALRKTPEDRELKVKLLEIYHAAGNGAAFDAHAEGFRRTIDADDPVWETIAVMGHQLSPENPAYRSVSATDTSPDADVDFDMDLSGMDDETHAGDATVDEDLGLDYADTGVSGNGLPETIEFSLDDQDETADSPVAVEDETEGMLDSSDEVSTKLDLARAYIDMGDPDSARNILEEVLEEGNQDQRKEAENLFSQAS
jgi:pilus assembly protein FimV